MSKLQVMTQPGKVVNIRLTEQFQKVMSQKEIPHFLIGSNEDLVVPLLSLDYVKSGSDLLSVEVVIEHNGGVIERKFKPQKTTLLEYLRVTGNDLEEGKTFGAYVIFASRKKGKLLVMYNYHKPNALK